MEASPQSLQQIQDDIDLYRTLLETARESDEDMAFEIGEYRQKLAELNVQLDKMNDVTSNALSSQPSTATSGLVAQNTTTPAENSSPRYLSLPSRKRERGEFDDDLDVKDMPKIKSRRSTPAQSPAISAVDSIGTDYFDDPELTNLLGDNYQQDYRRNRDYLRQQEAKRRQEEEDERLARQLQEEWTNAGITSPQPQQSRPSFPPASQTQATFRPNGSFSMQAPAPSPLTSAVNGLPGIKSEPFGTHRAPETPISLSSSDEDDDDLTFISGRMWNSLNPTTVPVSRPFPSSFNQMAGPPGAWPGTQSAYTSVPGASVYNNSAYSGPSSLPSWRSLPGMSSILGTQSHPFDLERVFGGTHRALFSQSWDNQEVDPAETQEEIRKLLHNIRPDEEIDPSEASEDQPEGLKARLMPHQSKGLAWMKKMEDGSNKGGILADDMGLGKTIQAISLMLSRPPPPDKKKPTLIVTPVALMDQWRRELLKMVRSRAAFTVIIVHGPTAKRSWEHIRHYDVILTSYGTLSADLKRKIRWEEKLKVNPDAKREKPFQCAMLDDKSDFHRVFLDEGQWIKNKSTQAALAACRLRAQFRWVLSGTPMQNSVDEMFSLIRFLRIRPYNDAEKFGKDIGRPLKTRNEVAQKRAMERLQALLRAILLRRTKKSEVDGKPILQLPEKRTIEARAIFDDDQLSFYKALETQSRIQFNRYVKAGTVGQNYSKALVLLLRLRQCCCSPQLITNCADFATESGVEGIDMVANAEKLPDDGVRRLLEQEDLECPVCFDACENAVIFNACCHAICTGCFSRMVDAVQAEESVRCPHCRATVDSTKITDLASFNKVYRGDDGGAKQQKENKDSEGDSDTNSEVGSEDSFWDDDVNDRGDLKDFIVDDDAKPEEDTSSDDEDDLDKIKKPSKKRVPTSDSESMQKGKDKKPIKKHKKKSKGKKKQKTPTKSLAELRKDGLKNLAAKRKYLRQLSKIYQPSAKIDKTLSILTEIRNTTSAEKTIVFSSFTSFLDLLEVPLSQDQTLNNYTRYDGSMSAKDRNEAVLRFTDDPNCRIILVSIKAGNAGLNLTVANHVLILDPFWNPFVEYQAADRCYRIGQTREVTVHRVLIGEEGMDHVANPDHVFTVEDRILALQEKKRALVESALDENAASSVGRLGVRELGYLFGVNDIPGR